MCLGWKHRGILRVELKKAVPQRTTGLKKLPDSQSTKCDFREVFGHKYLHLDNSREVNFTGIWQKLYWVRSGAPSSRYSRIESASTLKAVRKNKKAIIPPTRTSGQLEWKRATPAAAERTATLAMMSFREQSQASQFNDGRSECGASDL